MYTVTITPPPLSGAFSVATSSTQITTTIEYNISYTVTVGVNTAACGVQEAMGSIFLGESGSWEEVKGADCCNTQARLPRVAIINTTITNRGGDYI
jgi:hypothetical protein